MFTNLAISFGGPTVASCTLVESSLMNSPGGSSPQLWPEIAVISSYTRWCPSSLAKLGTTYTTTPISLWFMVNISLYLLWFINQLITGGHHIVLTVTPFMVHVLVGGIPTPLKNISQFFLIPGQNPTYSTGA